MHSYMYFLKKCLYKNQSFIIVLLLRTCEVLQWEASFYKDDQISMPWFIILAQLQKRSVHKLIVEKKKNYITEEQ